MIFALIFQILSAFVSPARADVPVTHRYDWQYQDGAGYFHADQGGQGSWTETINGVPTFHFVQSERTNDYVKLYDASRQFYVWLYAVNAYLQGPGDAAPHFLRTGHWDDRRLLVYKLSDGATNYFNLYPGKVWRWARNGIVTDVKEILRNDQQIQVYDATTHHTFALMDRELWAKPDAGTWYKLADSTWN
jgi:hypothetical protein